MFKELTDKINYSDLELAILKFWKENNVFEQSITLREGQPGFTFYEGPPTANGRPGIHHVMSRTLKDLVCRYKTMRGFQVHRKAGWDTHGLPVEIEVEKMLGFKHKEDIVRYGVSKFNEECKKSVWKYKVDWEKMTERMGYWVNLNDPYITFTNNYIESIWWALKQYFDKGLIYKGFKIQPYCPRCETPLSSHEVSLGYEDVKDPSIYIKLKKKDEENTFFLVWTTTPWTLISNVAIAIGPKVDYVKVEHKGEKLILAEARLGVLDGEYSVLDKFKGSTLLGNDYEPIFTTGANLSFVKKDFFSYRIYKTNAHSEFDNAVRAFVRIDPVTNKEIDDEYFVLTNFDGQPTFIGASLYIRLRPLPTLIKFVWGQIVRTMMLKPDEMNWTVEGPQAYFVIEGDFVTTEDGSGIVHIAPAYGEDDYQVSRKYGLPTIHPVNKSGEFGPEVTKFSGKFVKVADPEIILDLKERRILYKKEMITHSYPHCWRCKTPLLYYARESWYIATTKYAKRMVELNKTINWHPAEVGEGRFGNWLEENKDWSLSRDRFWGTPLPIWVCEKCGAQKCVGSVEEYKQGKGVQEPIDLHKPHVDAVTFTCTCGGEMKRTPELIDVWFDSGAMPFAQWHYPFENKILIDSGEQHPSDFICEGVDQTRGWFYSLHSISTFLFDRPAYKNILVNELILDKDGQKMSKTRGNTVDPFKILEKYGADTTRWYLVATSPPWRPTLFDEDGLVEVQRKFLGTLLNTYAFFSMYANIDKFTYTEESIPVAKRQEIDRWILSSLNSLIKVYEEAMDDYDVTKAARAVSDFTIDQLSNWYVRRNRRRFWKNEHGADKVAAYQTLYECLLTIAKLMAPFAPFLAEELYLNLNSVSKREKDTSIHLAMMPKADESVIDLALESRMEKAERIVSLVRAIRNKSNLKVRQPLKRIIVPVSNDGSKAEIERMEDVILDEINVKKIEYVHDDSEIVHKTTKPNFKVLGPKHGKNVQPVAAAIRTLTPKQIKELETAGSITLDINGSGTVVAREDVEIVHEDIKGWIVESDTSLTVALDIELTVELIDEGFAREFVNRVQNMRKDADFEITDRIKIVYSASPRLAKALKLLEQYVCNETLAVELRETSDGMGSSEKLDINGEACTIMIQRVKE